jgi:hypothetical protein
MIAITEAERRAVAWGVVYQSPLRTSGITIMVLVPEDGTSPEDFGAYRLIDMGLALTSYPHVRTFRQPTLSDADLMALLRSETDIERDERRAWWQRQEDGPDEWPRSSTSMVDLVTAGYRALMERRR